MSGEAITSRFMLNTATLMLGTMAALQTLSESNSIGLVKNVTLKSVPKFTNLTQGVRNSIVMSKQTGNDLTVSAEMFEYTPANIAYAMSLDGSTMSETIVEGVTTGAVTTDAAVIPMTATAGFVAGQKVALHANPRGEIFIREILSVQASTSITLVTVYPGVANPLASGAKVTVMNVIAGGGNLDDQPYLSCKITGQLADDSWVTILIGKIRVTSGLNLAFKTDNFDSVPLTLESHDLLPTDANYAFFTDATTGNVSQALIFTAPVGA